MWRRAAIALTVVFSLTRAQSSSAGAAALGAATGDSAAMATNMQKFAELYGFATQMAKLGGSMFRQSSSGSGSSSPYSDYGAAPSSSSSFYPSYSNNGGNGILSEIIRSSAGGGGGGNYRMGSQDDSALARAASSVLAEYGGLQTASRAQAPRTGQSGFQSLLSTFLGSSVPDNDLPPPPTPRPRPQRSLFEQFLGGGLNKPAEEDFPPPPPPPQQPKRLMPSFADLLSPSYESKPTQQLNFLELLGMERPTTTTRRPLLLFDRSEKYGVSQGASDIDAIVNALMRSGARPAPPSESAPPSRGLLAQFLGR